MNQLQENDFELNPEVSFKEAILFWLKLGFISFGGPAGQISVMHQELVEQKKWISEKRFMHALNYCMLLPGPEAQQLTTYIGWLMHKTKGGIIAGLFSFYLPFLFSSVFHGSMQNLEMYLSLQGFFMALNLLSPLSSFMQPIVLAVSH